MKSEVYEILHFSDKWDRRDYCNHAASNFYPTPPKKHCNSIVLPSNTENDTLKWTIKWIKYLNSFICTFFLDWLQKIRMFKNYRFPIGEKFGCLSGAILVYNNIKSMELIMKYFPECRTSILRSTHWMQSNLFHMYSLRNIEGLVNDQQFQKSNLNAVLVFLLNSIWVSCVSAFEIYLNKYIISVAFLWSFCHIYKGRNPEGFIGYREWHEMGGKLWSKRSLLMFRRRGYLIVEVLALGEMP